MKYYLDITLLPDNEIGYAFLLGRVYQQLHLAFIDIQAHHKENLFGIAFPDYEKDRSQRLGRKIRIFSEQEDSFKKINLSYWFRHYIDYVHLTSCRTVPETVNVYVQFYRRQYKSSRDRLLRRMIKRSHGAYEPSVQKLSNFKEQKGNLPYVILKSLSNGEQFPLFIGKRICDSLPKEKNQFSSYGLAKQGGLPQF